MDEEHVSSGRPAKRTRLLSDESSAEESDTGHSNESQHGQTLNINEDFAKRFEHNKKREELHKLQEKYGTSEDNARKRRRSSESNGSASHSEDDSDSESEDDEGELATQDLDTEIFDTLNAIRSKDPRVYDKSVQFYRSNPDRPSSSKEQPAKRQPDPVLLRDYHRQNLLGEVEHQDETPVPTYAEEQAAMKRDIRRQVQEADEDNESASERDEFFTAKDGQESRPSAGGNVILDADVEAADQNPDSFLSKYMASRAWVPTAESRFQPFESDDDEDDDRADAFEEAYNMRFEDPKKANEKLISHSREAAAKHSVRREEPKGRKRARNREQEAKAAAELEREDEKARLRKLKIEEAQAKLERFKDAAGLRGRAVPVEQWSKFLESGWDSDKWEKEMEERFGDDYYDERDEELRALEDSTSEKKRKIKKPKWDDDIDIADIVPEFDEDERQAAQAFKISDEEDNGDANESSGGVALSPGDVEHKDLQKTKSEKKRQARLERKKLQELVDRDMADNELPNASAKRDGLFRYRDTSPTAFGLSAREILMANDSQLNDFAGLKRLASYRDTERKRRDKKKLGKKTRLKQWRKDTFGDAEGPTMPFEDYFRGEDSVPAQRVSNIIESGPSKKKRRARKRQITKGTN